METHPHQRHLPQPQDIRWSSTPCDHVGAQVVTCYWEHDAHKTEYVAKIYDPLYYSFEEPDHPGMPTDPGRPLSTLLKLSHPLPKTRPDTLFTNQNRFTAMMSTNIKLMTLMTVAFEAAAALPIPEEQPNDESAEGGIDPTHPMFVLIYVLIGMWALLAFGIGCFGDWPDKNDGLLCQTCGFLGDCFGCLGRRLRRLVSRQDRQAVVGNTEQYGA